MPPPAAPRLAAALAACVFACAPAAPRPAPAQAAGPVASAPAPPPEPPRSVLLVVIDGVRWQDVFLGVDPSLAARAGPPVVGASELLPTLYGRALAGGSALGPPWLGEGIVASGPNFVSLPGYLELLTGRRSHGCRDNMCPPTRERTLLDQCLDLPGVGQNDVAAISSWEMIERASSSDPSRIVVSTGRSGGATRDRLRYDAEASALLDAGARSTAAPGQYDYRPDRFTAPIILRYLATHRPRCAFFGLGDPDEHGHARNYPAYVESLRAFDRFLADLFATLDASGDYGRSTAVFITVDHGRSLDFAHHGASYPESSRAWLVATGAGVARRGFVRAPQAALADIAPTARRLLGLAPDLEPGAGTALEGLLR